MSETEEYKLENKCYGCKSENDLRQLTYNDFTCTVCYSCEQKVIGAMLGGF